MSNTYGLPQVGEMRTNKCHYSDAEHTSRVLAVEEDGMWVFGKAFKVTAVCVEAKEGDVYIPECGWKRREVGEVYSYELLLSGEAA